MTPSRIACACLLASTLLPAALAFGASTPYSFECDPSAAIWSDRNEHKRVGYIMAFQGLGSSYPNDLKVAIPYNPAAGGKPAPSNTTVQVVGVIESFEWNGEVASPIKIVFYVSKNNAMQIKAAMQRALASARIDQLTWSISDYDQAAGKWYQQSYPMNPGFISGIVAGRNNPQLDVDLNPAKLKNAPVYMYKVSLSVAPAAGKQYPLSFSSSSSTHVTKMW